MSHPLSEVPVVRIAGVPVTLFNAGLFLAAVCRMAECEPYTSWAATDAAGGKGAAAAAAREGTTGAGESFPSVNQLLAEWAQRPPPASSATPAAATAAAPAASSDLAAGPLNDNDALRQGSKWLAPAAANAKSPTQCFFTYSSHHAPSGIFKVVDSLSYPTPQGYKVITRAGVDDQLGRANRRYVTDLMPDPNPDTTEQLIGLAPVLVDEARFALLAMMDLVVERKMFNPDGTLTGLAKRDLKKNSAAVAAAASEEPAGASSTASPAAHGGRGGKPVNGLAASAAATGVEVERNARGILLEKCAGLLPYVPMDKLLTFTFEQDPAAPRHKPRYRATVAITGLKAKQTSFIGEWCATKRDAEVTACSAALVVLNRGK